LNKQALAYLILSFLSGILELGMILLVINERIPLYYIPILGLAYQIGPLFKNPILLPSKFYLLAIVITLILSILPNKLTGSFFISILLLSVGLQGMRELALDGQEVSTFKKRLSRICGFIGAPLFICHLITIVSVCALLTTLLIQRRIWEYGALCFNNNLKPDALSFVMVIHQSHYFSYAYFIPYLFILLLGVNLVYAGLVFAIGWISYSAANVIFGKKHPKISLFLGHLLASTMLASIFYYSNHLEISLLAWFMCGFGGGTVYCIRALQRGMRSSSDLELWENIGHNMGLFISLIGVFLLREFTFTFVFGSILAATTALLALFLRPATVQIQAFNISS